MKDGKIAEAGKYKDLIEFRNSEHVEQLGAHKGTLKRINPCKNDDTISSRSCQTNHNSC